MALFADVDMELREEGSFCSIERQLEIAHLLLETAAEVFETRYGRRLSIEEHGLAIFSATTELKLSLHIHMPRALFPDLKNQLAFWEAVKQRAEESGLSQLLWSKGEEGERRFVADLCVYIRHGDFRLPFQAKHGKDNPLRRILFEGLGNGEDDVIVLRAATPTAPRATMFDTADILPDLLPNNRDPFEPSGERSLPRIAGSTKGEAMPELKALLDHLLSPRKVRVKTMSGRKGARIFEADVLDDLACLVCQRRHSIGANTKLHVLMH